MPEKSYQFYVSPTSANVELVDVINHLKPLTYVTDASERSYNGRPVVMVTMKSTTKEGAKRALRSQFNGAVVLRGVD